MIKHHRKVRKHASKLPFVDGTASPSPSSPSPLSAKFTRANLNLQQAKTKQTITMTNINDLPAEIKLRILSECPIARTLSRSWYSLHNLLYRDNCLRLKDEDYWLQLKPHACSYVRSLDGSRGAARRINLSEFPADGQELDRTEFLSDSWYILYNVLFLTPKFFGADPAAPASEISSSADPQGGCEGDVELLSGVKYHCNLWLRVQSCEAKVKNFAVAICGAEPASEWEPHDVLLDHYFPPHVDDWVKEQGTYCFNLGKLVVPAYSGEQTLKKLRVMVRRDHEQTSLGHVGVLGVDFVPYSRKNSWLLFYAEQDAAAMVFNPFEVQLARAAGNQTSDNVPQQGSTPAALEHHVSTFYSPASEPTRHFTFKYPHGQPTASGEQADPDWRYPYLVG